METTDKVCEKIILSSEDYLGKMNIRDVWATSIEQDSNINKYTANPGDFGISVEYPKIVENFDGNEEIEVCIIQKEPAKAKGGIIFTPDSETNVVVEYGTWLFVNLDEPKPLVDTSSNTVAQSGSSNTNTANTGKVVLGIEENKQNIEEEKVEINNEVTANGITGAAIGTGNKSINAVTIIIILAIIGAFIALLSYRKNKTKRRMMEYGY